MTIPAELRFFGKQWLLLIVLFNFGCQWHSQIEKEVVMTESTFLYHWDTGSIPPPDYYELDITIRPTHAGEICFRPDYPSASTPSWKESFEISHSDHSNLWHSIRQLPTPEKIGDPLIGGSRETLHLQYAKQKPVEQELASNQGRKVGQMIKNLVPQDIWLRLFNRFEAYREERR